MRDAIEAGIDPAALVDAVNEAQTQCVAARAEMEGTRAPGLARVAEVYARMDSLGVVGATLGDALPGALT
ncbi:MAG: hypothetical protein J2P19_07995 [Pseudonocardia sp.]|nr:hypothetical protein [Pseudonocardia sp.]